MTSSSATATRVGAIAGLVGSGVILVASIVTALAYTGSAGESYSPFNHFVSELGETANSELATLFNIGLVIGGLCLVAFMIGLRSHLDGAWGWATTVIGVFAGLFGALVGVFPMDNLGIHSQVAALFFIASMLAVLVFTIALLAGQAPSLPRWLAWPGGIAAALSLLFLVVVVAGGLSLGAPADRPAFLLVTTLEWLAVLAITVWVACASMVLLASES
jgi:hypothetical membrane protein